MKNFTKQIMVSFLFTFFVALICFSTLNAQDTKFRDQAWRYGLNAGLQINGACLGWQQLHGLDANFHAPESDIDQVDGTGMGIYGGLFGEYLSESWWGFQLRLSYDTRNALVEDITRIPIPSFDTKSSYLSLEPLFRLDQPFIPNLNFYIGPFLSANLGGTYIYKPDKDKSATEPEVDIAKFNSIAYGLEGGIAYDIKFKDINNKSAMYLSPFVDCSWLFNQKEGDNDPNQNSISDIWSTISYRFGVRFSVDYREDAKEWPLPEPKKAFLEIPYENTIYTKNVKGYFPIHPYIFFEKGNLEIPARYTMLTKSEAQNFNQDDLGDFMKGDLTTKETNIDQLMRTYYNVMNIYADRMKKNPNEKLTLSGSDPDEINGGVYANKVKSYLVDVFGIDPDRITIEVAPPQKPSGSALTDPTFAGMINDENRRVVFVFSNPDMLKPLPYTIRDESSIDNDLIFTIGKDVPYNSWDVTITGENKTLYFGPFAYRSERINPAEMMRFLESGKYNAQVVITDKAGNKTEENISFNLVKDKELKNASRYLMIFEYNSSDPVKSYEKVIRNEITPGIKPGAKVVIQGHTDIIGNVAGNLKLSQDRADEAKAIIVDQLALEKKTISVKAYGFGQSKMQYTFDNRYPEGRMYNRNIFVEVIE
jgi:outer membrane protein OmpA-like peptidoglycan-associated protein